ncbi:hypothetical protein niasHT_017085 [Heterodera trifolii]|uniref:G-protein coupled receptors family 1 profile domain-containing protein n=1 Tax=Heterodera trifolii TaxID=157864 RepID=A0ABD2KY80_9BILA
MHLFRLNNSRENLCALNDGIFDSDLRLFLVGFIGSSVSIASILQNSLLFYVFSTSRKLRRQNYVNPVLLAFFDIFVSLIYLLISPVHFVAHRLRSPFLASFWSWHVRVFYCLQHFALTVCNFLLVVASLERFLANGPLQSQMCVLVLIVRNKSCVIISILAFAFVLKATLYFEIEFLPLPNCSNLTDISSLDFEQSVVSVWVTESGGLFQIFRFWTRNILTVILPFVVLAYCNCKIVQKLRRRRRLTLGGEYSESVIISQTNEVGQGNEQQTTRRAETQLTRSPRTLIITQRNSEKNPTLRIMPRDTTASNGKGMLAPKAIARSNQKKEQQADRRRDEKPKREREKRQNLKLETTEQIRLNYLMKTSTAGDKPKEMAEIIEAKRSAKNSTGTAPITNNFGVRVATRTLVMVVGCYLISNSMSTFLNIWEFFDVQFLRHKNLRIYLTVSDVAALLTICGCALRLPIYVCNDRRIRRAICRAIIRFRFCCSKAKPEEIVRGEEAEHFLEKYSIVIVSNSLRSNLTGMLSQFDWGTFQGKRSFDQLAILVQNRQKFLVQMTINLGAVQEIENSKISAEE